MLLVLGSAVDEQPRLLVEYCMAAGEDAALVTPADLSRPGWRLRCGRPESMRAAVGNRIVGVGEVDAVVTALPWIGPYDLPHIVPGDRDYVAQEMSAFLLAWLRELDCPVLDRPTPTSLTGCGRAALEWAALATALGLDSDPDSSEPTVATTIVGTRAVGDAPPDVGVAARVLAAAGGRSLVTLRFLAREDAMFISADPRPEVGSEPVATELLTMLAES
jgi:hypothetical protein